MVVCAVQVHAANIYVSEAKNFTVLSSTFRLAQLAVLGVEFRGRSAASRLKMSEQSELRLLRSCARTTTATN